MLDPWISYDGIQKDYNKDANLFRYLEDSMMSLHKYFNINYARRTDMQHAFTEQPHTSSSTGDVSPSKVSFTSRYKQKVNMNHNELMKYFKLPWEDWDLCNPHQWWVGQCTQIPCLFHLVHNIL